MFSVKADEQLKVLADRFQKPGGFDMWSEKDGPQLFEPVDGLPSTRFFPKGVVHSIKPYAKFSDSDDELVGGGGLGEADGGGGRRRTRRQLKGALSSGDEVSVDADDNVSSDSSLKLAVNNVEGKARGKSSSKDGKKQSRRKDKSMSQQGAQRELIGAESVQRSGIQQRHIDQGGESERRGRPGHTSVGREHKEGGRVVSNIQKEFRRSNGSSKSMKSKSDVYNMSLKQDGSYGF